MVMRSATYARSPRRWPSSSSPRWRSEQPTIPAPGTNAASMPPAAWLESVSAEKPSTVRSPIMPAIMPSAARPRIIHMG